MTETTTSSPTTEVLTTSRERAGRALDWWRALQDTTADGTPNPRADRAVRARLRRAEPGDPFAAAEPAVLDLHTRLWGASWSGERTLRLTLRLALVLAHVREEAAAGADSRAERFARALGPSRLEEDDGVLKALRFRALLGAHEEEDVVRRFRRAVELAGRRANVRDLARVLLDWEHGATRTRFAFDYFAAGAAVPGDVRAAAETVA